MSLLTVGDLRRFLEPEVVWRKTLVCRPEDEEVVTAAAEVAGPGIRVLASPHVPLGQFFWIDDEKLDEPIRLSDAFRVRLG